MTPTPTRTFDTIAGEITEDMGTSVRTSVGAPRWPLKYVIEHTCPLLYPGDLRTINDRDEFEPLYRARLDDRASAISEALVTIANVSGRRPVLLCFENVHKGDGTWCHRQILAQWLEERTGLTVPELSVPKPPKPAKVAEPLTEVTLFGEIEIPGRTR